MEKSKISQTTCMLGLVLAIVLHACSFLQEDAVNSQRVARVFDTYLYKDDIIDLIPLGTSPKDSAILVNSYLESWIKQQLILNKARLNLSEQEVISQMEKQLEDYRSSLIIYAYKKELIKQKLDTTVSNEKIREYYDENGDNLILKEDIIRVRYLKVPKAAPALDSAKKWCSSDMDDDIASLEEYSHQYAKSYLLTEKVWILFDNLKLELGPGFAGKDEELKPGTLYELEDSMNIHLVYVLDFMKKENPAPMEYERENIREIILNRRRNELILKMEASTYQEGISKNYFELYKQEK